jgi:hypothetical protein
MLYEQTTNYENLQSDDQPVNQHLCNHAHFSDILNFQHYNLTFNVPILQG